MLIFSLVTTFLPNKTIEIFIYKIFYDNISIHPKFLNVTTKENKTAISTIFNL